MHGEAGDGIDPRRRDFGERLEHEAPFAEAGMGHHQAGRVHHCVPIENQIQIKCARRVRNGTHTAELPLEVEERIEEVTWRSCCGAHGSRVEEARLVSDSDWSGILKSGEAQVLQVSGKRGGRIAEGPLAVT